jgi:hypothetical protein
VTVEKRKINQLKIFYLKMALLVCFEKLFSGSSQAEGEKQEKKRSERKRRK